MRDASAVELTVVGKIAWPCFSENKNYFQTI